MIARLLPLAAAAALLCVPTVDATEAARPAPAKPTATDTGEPFDVLALVDARPVVVRFRVTADGKPLDDAWKQFADMLFAKLDADKNGSLDSKEIGRLRGMLTLLTGRSGQSAPAVPGAGLSREGFGEYLRKADLGPFRLPSFTPPPVQQGRRIVRAGSITSPAELDKAILGLLDTDKDGKLTAAELAAAATVFPTLDADENEIITAEELLRRPPALPFFVQEEGTENPAGPGLEVYPLTRKGPDTNLARRLLTRYGLKTTGASVQPPRPAPKAGEPVPAAPPAPTIRRLTRKNLGLDPKTFAALDQDGDEELDAEELARFADNCLPEVEISFQLGTVPAGRRPVEVTAPGAPPVTARAAGGMVAVEMPGVRLDLVPPTGAGPLMTLQGRYKTMFRALDQDGNGYVDSTEAQRNPLFREVFPVLDLDGDGKVFEKEMTAALADAEGVAAEAARGLLSADVVDAGRGLFGLIDTDGDGRLSVREVRAMPKLVERFDANKDGAIGPGEVPRRFVATLSRGLLFSGRTGPMPVPVGMVAQPTPRPPVGPLWFQKMDRNRDNDVSRREFLGTDEDFRRLDTDGDGLIDAREAEAAGRGATPPPESESDE